ncbi:MAG: CoA transferase [Deltaproteobacteria bacterium]|nr:CoA transferase [Deltaproteobacteria bacterium]
MGRVIDLGSLAGAYAARLLAESGHDVIRIDSPGGDAMRRIGPFLGDASGLEHGAFHHFLNAGKRSLSVNLDSAAGWRLFLELLRTADAVVTSRSLPVDEDDAPKADIVWTDIEEAEDELCAYARSGLLSLTGHRDGRPTLMGGHIVYLATGIHAAVATAAALRVLQSTGKGQRVRVAMQDCLETFVEQAMVEYTFSGTRTERRGNRGTITAVSGALPCKDGHWVVSQINRPGRWEKFVEWVRDPELMADSSLGSDDAQREKKDFIMDRVLAWSKQFTKSEIVEEGQRRRFPSSPVSTPLDLTRDAQLIARGYLAEADDPRFGRIPFPRGAVARVRGQEMGPAPTLGQHNGEILAELGYSDADRRAMVETGAVQE